MIPKIFESEPRLVTVKYIIIQPSPSGSCDVYESVVLLYHCHCTDYPSTTHM